VGERRGSRARGKKPWPETRRGPSYFEGESGDIRRGGRGTHLFLKKKKNSIMIGSFAGDLNQKKKKKKNALPVIKKIYNHRCGEKTEKVTGPLNDGEAARIKKGKKKKNKKKRESR